MIKVSCGIVGIGTEPCSGLNKGIISDIDTTVASVRRAKEKASLMSNCYSVCYYRNCW